MRLQKGFDADDLFVDRHIEPPDRHALDAEFRLAVAPRDVLEHFAGRDHVLADGRVTHRVQRPPNRLPEGLNTEFGRET